jgi:cell division protein FtsN
VLEDDQYEVIVSGFATRDEVEDYFPVIQSKGIFEVSIINLKGVAKPKLATDIPLPGADTTIMIVHQITEEDMTSSKDNYLIQVGAFKRKSNAARLRKKLAEILGMNVIITVEDGFHKVRIAGFESIYEIEQYIPVLVKNDIREIWVVTSLGMHKQKPSQRRIEPIAEVIDTFTEQDTTYLIIYESVEEDITTNKDRYAIQLGAFNRKINADVLRIKLATILDREVELTDEDGLYKVRIDGFRSRDDVEEYINVLLRNGVTDMRIVNLKGILKQRVVTNRLDTIQKPANDTSMIIGGTYTTKKKQKEIEKKPVQETTPKEVEVKKTQIVEPRKEVVEKQAPVVTRSTIEDRMLEAEYRSGLYEARWPGVEFAIQVAASKSISDPEVIKRKFGLTGEVNVTRSDEWYRFTVGHYIKFWQAREYRNILNTRNGLEDAIIVAFKNGKKIMFTDLLAVAEQTPLTGLTDRPVLSKAFSVQVMASKNGDISISSIRELYEVDEEIFIEYDETDGLYRYSIGNFTLYTDAAKVRNQIKLRGHKEVFVVGYKDGKRVADLKTLLE